MRHNMKIDAYVCYRSAPVGCSLDSEAKRELVTLAGLLRTHQDVSMIIYNAAERSLFIYFRAEGSRPRSGLAQYAFPIRVIGKWIGS